MRRASRLRAHLALVALVAASAACSGNDEDNKDATGPAPEQVEAGAPSDPLAGVTVDDGAVAAEAGGPAAASSDASPSEPATSQTAVGAADAQDGARRAPVGAGARGVTDDTIEIGLWYYDITALGAAVGAMGGGGNFDPSNLDPEKAAKVTVDHINANGGMGGRKVVPRIIKLDVANQLTESGSAQEAQKACAFFTEDHSVFAMMAVERGGNLECGRATNTAVVSDFWPAQPWLTSSMFGRYHDIWYGPNMMLAERRDRNVVESLWSNGFLTPSSKVGVMIDDEPGSKESAATALVPALQAHGIEPVAEIVYPDRFNSPWQNYVLQLVAAGADTVVFSSSTGECWAPIFMMRAAEDQRYRPKWGLGSDQYPSCIELVGAPKNQMANSLTMGWIPSQDLGTVPEEDYSATTRVCVDIDEANGNPGVGFFCEPLFFLKYVLDRAPELSPAGMSNALAAVANTYPSAITIDGVSVLAPERHDGAAVYRMVRYDTACNDGDGCFTYFGQRTDMRP